MNPYRQTLYVVWGNQLLFVTGLILYWDILMIPIAVMAMFVFGCFSEVAMHRYYTHKSFITTSFKEKILRVFALLAGQGAILSWVTVHRMHHAFEDTPKDPHSPLYVPWWKIFLGLFSQNYPKNLIVDLLRSSGKTYFIFENTYYWLIWTSIWIVSFLIHPALCFFIIAGSSMWYIATSVVNIASHAKLIGTQKYSETVATNSNILNFFTAIGHHNNHHKFPGRYTYSTGKEIDIYAWFIEKVFKKL